FALIVQTFPDKMDYLVGESYVALAVAPIPRWLWANKNRMFALRDNLIVYYLTGASVPPSFGGALYANFGWAGVALGMFGWGALQARLYLFMLRRPDDDEAVILYSVTLIHFASIGNLAIADAIGHVVPTAVALWFIREKRAAPVPILPAPKPLPGEF